MNLVVAIEGVDGAGKTTYITKLEAIAWRKGLKTKRQSFPTTANSFGIAARNELARDNPDARKINEFCRMDRVLWAEKVRDGKFRSCDVIFCDRYVYSGIAYSAADGSPLEELVSEHILLASANPMLTPNMTVFLDVPPEEAQARLEKRGESDALDRDINKQRKAYEAFQELRDFYWWKPEEFERAMKSW